MDYEFIEEAEYYIDDFYFPEEQKLTDYDVESLLTSFTL